MAQTLTGPEFRSPYKAPQGVISPSPASSFAESAVDQAQKQQVLMSNCLFLITPYDAEIDIDGKKESKSPLLIMLAKNGAIPHAITIKKDGYFTVQRTLTPDGSDMTVTIVLQRDWSQ